MNSFWHWFVVVITVGSLIGSLWLLFANARGKPGEDTGHVWDDNLSEYNNPLPRWWLNLFVITVVFAAGYLLLYPGLGSFPGVGGWTKEKQLAERLDTIKARRAQAYAQFKDKDVATLAADSAAQPFGRELFLNNCAGCHGADAHGAVGFPNLADKDWLYGGGPDEIAASIRGGRNGAMPAFNSMLQPQAVDDLVALATHWSDGKLDAQTRERAVKQFGVTCAACHGPEGHGNTMIGAPNLTDDVWLHGGSSERVRETIMFGRNSKMPAHEALLAADELRLVAAYVYGLSHQP